MTPRVAPLLLLILTGCHTARPASTSPSHGRPHLKLGASAYSGFAPMEVLLTAELTGVPADDGNFADPGERWKERFQLVTASGTAPEVESLSERQPGEGTVKPEPRPKLYFERPVSLTDPGNYRYQLTIRGADGTEVHSNWVTVHVVVRN